MFTCSQDSPPQAAIEFDTTGIRKGARNCATSVQVGMGVGTAFEWGRGDQHKSSSD